jgi:mono/diheme cytochrome c family protein
MRAKTACLAVLAALVLAVPGLVARAAADEREARGREIAEAACSPCHAIDRQGASPNPQAPVFRELGRKYRVEDLEEALGEGILVGHPAMPQVRMEPEDIEAFLAWLVTIQR